MQPDDLIYLLALNLKMSIIKVTGVSFETPKDCRPRNLKMMPLTVRSWTPQLSHK